MSATTGIEWTDATWNPVTGCTEVSPGCDHCYAKTFAERWRDTPGHYFEHGFDVQLRPDKLDLPLRWRKPRRIFVNSMSDLFHDEVPRHYIAQIFAVMALAPQHTFQVLTKRHHRLRSLIRGDLYDIMADCIKNDFDEIYDSTPHYAAIRPERITWPLPNVWLGVSAENQQWADIRIPALLDTPAAVRFLSAEPLLGSVSLRAEWLWSTQSVSPPTLSWVIVGGESGHGARPMDPAWARSLRDQCQVAGVAFLFKQWGAWAPTGSYGVGWLNPGRMYGETWDEWPHGYKGREILERVSKKAAGRELDGQTWDQYPELVTA